MWNSFGVGHYIILTVVATTQLYLYLRAAREANGSSDQEWRELQSRCRSDLRQRMARGMSPDWIYYQNEIERGYEPQDDRIRRLASAALAVGLGGTLLAIVTHFLLQSGARFEPSSLLASTGVSLLGSLFGVCGHLLIVLRVLPRAERTFQAKTKKFFEELRSSDESYGSAEGLTRTLQLEMTQIRQAVSQQFNQVFATAITGFPAVVDGLRTEVANLSAVVKAQGDGLGPATAMLAACAESVEVAASRLQPGTEGLNKTATLLAALPGQLGKVLDERRDGWLDSIRQEQKARLDELMGAFNLALEGVAERERRMLERARELLAAVSEINSATGRIPEQFSEQVDKVASRLGREFGREAQQHTADLMLQIQKAFDQLARKVAGHEQEWRNNLTVVVSEVLRGVEGQVREGVAGELAGAAKSLREVASELPKASGALQEGVLRWESIQGDALKGWQEAGKQIFEATKILSELEGPLRSSLGALKSGGDHLGKTLREAEGLSDQVAKTLSAATSRQLEPAQRVQKAAEELLQKAYNSQQKAEQVLMKQGDLIRLLLGSRLRDPKKPGASA